jgi:phage virion morphogenesis protein
MALDGPIGLEERIEDEQVRSMIEGLLAAARDTTPAMKLIGEEVLTSVKLDFERGGREGGQERTWQPLADSTVEERTREGSWPGQILVRKGISGGLLGSISYQAFADRAVVGARAPYAAVHHLGAWFQTLKGHRTVKIPARPYLMFQPEDWPIIRSTLNDHFMAAARR